MKIAVIGVGTAGLISLSHYCAWLDSSWEVISIHDPAIQILGIGESSTPKLPVNLCMGTDFSFDHDAELLDATMKHHVRYVNWRKHDVISPIDAGSHGIHFNNFKLKDYMFSRLKSKWGSKFKEMTGTVTEIYNKPRKAVVVLNNVHEEFDYVIDCRGFPKDYSDYIISDCLPLNSCLVNSVEKPGDWHYTYHLAHKNGWMFGIPLSNRQGWGYLYNDTITSKEDAITEISELCNQPKEELNLREFKFKPYRAKKVLEGRILKNGNSYLFYEPLEALSASYYDDVNRVFYDHIIGKFDEEDVNNVIDEAGELLEIFICYIYHGGSIYNTEFWKQTKEKTSAKIYNSPLFANIVNQYRALDNPNLGNAIKPFSSWNWFKLDKQFEYNYFQKR